MAQPTPDSLARRKKRLWLVAGIGLIFAIGLGYVRLKPIILEARNHRAGKTSNGAVRDNLVQIGAAADAYFERNPSTNAVVVKELIHDSPDRLSIQPVLGENYDTLVVSRGWTTLKISLPDGTEITVPRH